MIVYVIINFVMGISWMHFGSRKSLAVALKTLLAENSNLATIDNFVNKSAINLYTSG